MKQQTTLLLKRIKNTDITFSPEQKNEITHTFGNYNQWRLSQKGNLNIKNDGVGIDSAWQEWAELYPAYFDTSISDKDMALELDGIIKTLKEGIPFDNRPEAIEVYKTDLLKQFADEMNVDDSKLTKAFNRLDRLINQDYKKRLREALREQSIYHDIEIGEMKAKERSWKN